MGPAIECLMGSALVAQSEAVVGNEVMSTVSSSIPWLFHLEKTNLFRCFFVLLSLCLILSPLCSCLVEVLFSLLHSC